MKINCRRNKAVETLVKHREQLEKSPQITYAWVTFAVHYVEQYMGKESYLYLHATKHGTEGDGKKQSWMDFMDFCITHIEINGVYNKYYESALMSIVNNMSKIIITLFTGITMVISSLNGTLSELFRALFS